MTTVQGGRGVGGGGGWDGRKERMGWEEGEHGGQ